MGVTSKLLALYQVDQQLHGLKSRLRSAESYLKAQEFKLEKLEEQLKLMAVQLRQLEAAAKNDEVTANGIDERIAMLRERMNSAATSKQHQALLVEINTLKNDKGEAEERGLESLTKLDEVKGEVATLEARREELRKVRTVAEKDRDARQAEIGDRLRELEGERVEKAKDVPGDALTLYETRLTLGIEEVMSAVELSDKRRMEFTCALSNQLLPIELVNKLLRRDGIVTCPISHAILYLPDDLRDALDAESEKKRKKTAAANK
ncbi:MAG: hypothetical protein KDA20_08440 [Phycisphaerales bacterium]|nr:hypothetical protein [Phycisphaerales bacterium]